MRVTVHKTFAIWLAIGSLVIAGAAMADDDSSPRTGYFRIWMTPVEMIGEASAESFAETLAPDDPISWQVYVPPGYDPEDPPGVVVFVSSISRGGPPRAWNPVLEEHNLIWVGANGDGKTAKTIERIIKAIIAPFVLRNDYTVDLSRCYVAGFADGGKVAGMVMAARPEQFKGGIYLGGAELWDETPAKIDLIRQQRHAFVIGTKDPRLNDFQRIFNGYKSKGVDDARLIKIPNHANRMTPARYFGQAIAYVDERPVAAGN